MRMLSYINFAGMQMKPLLFNLINKTILPLNDITINITAGDKFGISFDNTPFKNYFLLVTSVTFTSFNKLSNKDMFDCGFVYKPSFNSFLKDYRNVDKDSSIVKLDFKIVERDNL